MIVCVTTHHIAHGIRQSNLYNPIALALQEQEPLAVVTPHKAHRQCQHGQKCHVPFCGVTELSREIKEWLIRYHRGDYFISPISFEL